MASHCASGQATTTPGSSRVCSGGADSPKTAPVLRRSAVATPASPSSTPRKVVGKKTASSAALLETSGTPPVKPLKQGHSSGEKATGAAAAVAEKSKKQGHSSGELTTGAATAEGKTKKQGYSKDKVVGETPRSPHSSAGTMRCQKCGTSASHRLCAKCRLRSSPTGAATAKAAAPPSGPRSSSPAAHASIPDVIDIGKMDESPPSAGRRVICEELVWAIFQRRSGLEALLAQCDSDLNLAVSVSEQPPQRMTALGAAALFGESSLVAALLTRGANPNAPGGAPLHSACGAGNAAMAQALLCAGADPNAADSTPQRNTPLHLACARGHAGIVSLLLAAGARPNVETQDRALTPLFLACEAGHAGTVEQLIAAGADSHAASRAHGVPPLWCAARSGHTAVAEALLWRAGANPCAPAYGVSPLAVAAAAGHISTAVAIALAVDARNNSNSPASSPLERLNRAHALIAEALGAGSQAQSQQPPPLGTVRHFTFAELTQSTNNWDVSQQLGRGGFGAVYRGVLCGIDVAVKRMSSQFASSEWAQFTREVEALASNSHPNVLRLLGHSCESLDRLCIVSEFMPNGSLYEHLNSPAFTLNQRHSVCLDVARALSYLHSRNFVHMDIKPANVLLDARTQTLANTMVIGTLHYIAPELQCTPQDISCAADVFSFGVLLAEVLTALPVYDVARTVPFGGPHLLQAVALAVSCGTLPSLLASRGAQVLAWPPQFADGWARLVAECSKMKLERPSSDYILQVLTSLGPLLSGSSNAVCAGCVHGARTHAYVPCGHLCLCDACSQQPLRQRSCVVCGASATAVIRIIL
eukprot:TRINITY_DN1934_c0_g1_i2.p1 TRINITY_DN1934_c0_g1~~TRINITY_DN1934_c0_g1_i2.p1  ORF type:complete len:816 (-),score=137.71 TRINITY_DN1934_c0_g1_i2:43-2490(-)